MSPNCSNSVKTTPLVHPKPSCAPTYLSKTNTRELTQRFGNQNEMKKLNLLSATAWPARIFSVVLFEHFFAIVRVPDKEAASH